MPAPAITVSLDFELRWGLLDSLRGDASRYERNLRGVHEVVPRLLESFARRGIRATWATVGAVACEGWDEWSARAPAWPAYADNALRWDDAFRRIDPAGTLYFAPGLVRAIAAAEGQELGSHTFGHIYLREPGFTRADAAADAAAIRALFEERFTVTPRSFVFPRNQVAHTAVLREHGVRAWRENPDVFYWDATRRSEQTRVVRALRFADAVVPLGHRAAPARAQRASHFTRLTLPAPLFRLHRTRIARDAAQLRDGEVLHLWCHPHNLGADPARSVSRLEALIDAAREAAPASTRFAHMGDLSAEA